MQKLIKLIGFTSSIILLSGCEDQNTYQYLITHPAVMKSKMEACMSASKAATNLEKQRCEIVMSASTKFMALLEEQQMDSEKFGIRVLTAETDYANAKAQVAKLSADLEKAKAGSGNTASIHKLEADLEAAKKNCADKRDEVKMLLAVVGINAPN